MTAVRKWLPSFIICLLTSSASASPIQVSLKGGAWSFSRDDNNGVSRSQSGIGAYSVEFGYRILADWTVVIGSNLILSDLVKGSAGYGFDMGAKYYPLTDSGSTSMTLNSSSVWIQETWRPYAGLFMRQRIFGLSVSTSYIGPGVSLGVDYSFSKKWFGNLEFRYDYLYGEGDALAIQNNFLLGVGYEF